MKPGTTNMKRLVQMAMVACVACCVAAGQKAEAASLHLNLGNAVQLCLGDKHHHHVVKKHHKKAVKKHSHAKAHCHMDRHDRRCEVNRKERRR